MNHEKLKVVTSVEDKIVVNFASLFGICEISLSYFKKRLRDDIVTGE
jgi:hypothetical protein